MGTEPTKQIDDGGPAFPFGQVSESTGQPINGFFNPGMSLRDWLAGMALQGLMANPSLYNMLAELRPDFLKSISAPECDDLERKIIASAACKTADAVIAALKGGAQ